MHDAIVIGGSFAGMAAALQLVRANRQVVVIDAGQRRNRFARTSHGLLGQDGREPAQIWAEAQRQLLAYPTVHWVVGVARTVGGHRDHFDAGLDNGERFSGRRVVLANGVTDQLPDIPGIAERWGRSVFHCPYCHGYELGQRPIGVIASGPMSLHQAELLPDWGPVTFLTNDMVSLSPGQHDTLARRKVAVEEVPILRVTGDADVVLQDGRVLTFAGLFTATRTMPSGSLAQEIGCTMTETPLGSQIATSDTKETSVPGIFACGDAARAPHSLSLAIADGAWAGAQVHRSLVWPEG